MDARTIERAVAFIRERLEHHRMAFAMEVGEHLFREIYLGDREYFRATGQKDESIERIASSEGVKVSANTLRMCVHVHLLVKDQGRRAAPVPELAVWTWDALWDLEGDPESLAKVAAWVARENVPVDLARTVAQAVGPWLRAGGRVEDLLVGTSRDTPFRRLVRLAGMVESWVREGPVSRECRARALAVLDAIEKDLGRTSPGPASARSWG